MAIEEPHYTVIEAEDDFEIRSYDPIVVARVKAEGDFESAGNSGFRALADYIFGNNQKNTKIAMTAPVKMTESAQEGQFEIQFVMPREMNRENLPRPNRSEVEIQSLPQKLMAVLKYSGTWSKERFLNHKKILLEQIQAHQYEAISSAIFARYNPPFVPWFLRRNEVWIEVKKKAKTQSSETQTSPPPQQGVN